MHPLFWTGMASALILAGCAAQTPQAQLATPDTVRICTGHNCTDQPRSAALPQAAPSAHEAQAELRLQQLEALAEDNPHAAYDLGLRLLRGDGVPHNGYQALQWLRKAGEHNLLAAQLLLGRLYLAGLEEMGSDAAEAHTWLSRAAAQGSAEARQLLIMAEKAKGDDQAQYQAREQARKDWEQWMQSTSPSSSYYWHWGHHGWQRY